MQLSGYNSKIYLWITDRRYGFQIHKADKDKLKMSGYMYGDVVYIHQKMPTPKFKFLTTTALTMNSKKVSKICESTILAYFVVFTFTKMDIRPFPQISAMP
jgi:hypothetical protein